MTCTPYGPNALLVRFAERVGEEAFVRGRALVAELERHPPPGLVELVPAFTTLLLEFERRMATDATFVRELLARLEAVTVEALPPSPLKEIPVIYDGPDLARVAEAHGLAVREVAELHAAPVYRVYLLGFAPGFPYLGELDPRLHTPRLAKPRPRVPVGAVAIGGEHTGIYSVESPGGWNLIGRTPVKLFDLARGANGRDEEMFWLRPGDRVKFVPSSRGA